MEETTMGDENGASLMLAVAVLLRDAGYSEEEIKEGYMRAKADSRASSCGRRYSWQRNPYRL